MTDTGLGDTLKQTKAPHSSGYLSGYFLVSMPSVQDLFHKSLIFLCTHDKNGAMGWVVNSPLDGLLLSDVLKQMGLAGISANVPSGAAASCDFPVYGGGPVGGNRGFVVHSLDYQKSETLVVSDEIGVTATVDVLVDISGGGGAQQALFVLGYVSWDAGQLEDELMSNLWLQLPADRQLLFDTPPEAKWQAALAQLGVSEVALSPDPGNA